MKKVYWLLTVLLIVIVAMYIVLMVKFEDPIRMDLTDHVQLSDEDRVLQLPWYMRVGSTFDYKFNGSDMEGRNYTMFSYAIPEIFESSELNCIVCWETKQVIAFIGNTRAMYVIDETYPGLEWN